MSTHPNLLAAFDLMTLGCPVEVHHEHGSTTVPAYDPHRLHLLLGAHPERAVSSPIDCQPAPEVVSGRAFPIPLSSSGQGSGTRWDATKHIATPTFISLDELIRALAEHGCHPYARAGFRWRARCPLCLKRGRYDPRLSFTVRDGRLLLKDFGSCSRADVLAALGLSLQGKEVPQWRG